MEKKLSHFDDQGASRMVDTSTKSETERLARAHAFVKMKPETLALIQDVKIAKGDVLEVARLAGIMAAKRTGELIPLCHPLPITSVSIDFTYKQPDIIKIESTAKCIGRTGVEMEALTAVSLAALTIYDMCKSVDKMISIEHIYLVEKSGGKSGHFVRENQT